MRFMVVGVIAAGVEFVGFNGFVRYFGYGARVRANLVAVTFAMAVSFTLNRNWAFADLNDGGWPVIEFLVVTLVAAYGIQSAVIYWLSAFSRWKQKTGERTRERARRRIGEEGMGRGARGEVGSGRVGVGRARQLCGIGGGSEKWKLSDFWERNLVKAMALGMAMVWNFSWYRWYVFV